MSWDTLASELLARGEAVLQEWLPGGKRVGREFVVGSVAGESGRSLSVSLDTGKWSDFSDEAPGGRDLISLYAAIHGLEPGEAYRALTGKPSAGPFEFRLGSDKPTHTWTYRDRAGAPVLTVARYLIDGKKTYRQWSMESGRWKPRGIKSNRPLYNLPGVLTSGDKPILVVEGEKAADAAARIADGRYVVTTWPCGSNGWRHADLTPLTGKRVTLWPDSDRPGVAAMVGLKDHLLGIGCSVSILGVPEDGGGWDAADAETEGWDWARLSTWGASISTLYRPESPVPASVEVVDMEDSGFPPVIVPLEALWDDLGVPYSRAGIPVCNLDTAHKMLKHLAGVGIRYRYDTFSRRTLVDGRPLTDDDVTALARYLQGQCGLRSLTVNSTMAALEEYARINAFSEPAEWMSSLTWDGEDRLHAMMSSCFGADDTVYSQFVGFSMLVSAVARVFEPGCKVDTMVILEGAQGAKKSTALSILGGKWHTEAADDIGSKDFICALAGAIIVEIAELESFSKAEASRIKRVITSRVDRVRKPYGRIHEDHPRTCILVGTTNETSYLRDSTGARRFLPVSCGDIDTAWLSENRDQLWAEAVSRYRSGERWWNMPADAVSEQGKRRRVDPLEEKIAHALRMRHEVTIGELVFDILELDAAKVGAAKSAQVTDALRSIGWSPEWSRVNGAMIETWKRGRK